MKTTRLLTLLVIFAIVPSIAAQAPPPPGRALPDYLIGPLDELSVTVNTTSAQVEFSAKTYRVQADGTIILPHLPKPVKVGDLTVQQARDLIRTALIDEKMYSNPIVDVNVIDYRNSSVTVMGAVRNGGNLPLPANRMTITDAIGVAGGFLPTAGSRITVRGGPKRPKPGPGIVIVNGAEVYLKDDVLQGRIADVRVYDGDTIDVEVAPHFFVLGYVKNTTSEFNWEPGMTLLRAIAMAGGLAPEGAQNRIYIQRKNPKNGKVENAKMAKDRMSTLIEPNDVINVPKKRM